MSLELRTLEAIRDGMHQPYRDVIQAVIDIVKEPGPTNAVAWAFDAVREHEQEALREALRSVLDEFDYWVGPPRPAVGGGTVRVHNFGEVQPSMERVLADARRLLDSDGRKS